ncbi:uncharacterized protein LOC131229617 [Magnolia sinica]|uniref:uncharacterized protein LOC131229617 n=1 Tax=Magnolia sinica TaxID=86752 RepID=UPI002657ABE5|nr:uncharacterized protein LOC131229617 [Magnolia sinica]
MASTLSLLLLSLPLFTLSHEPSDGPHVLPGTTTCRDVCGSVPIKYPFGTGFGCGHPDFATYVKCIDRTLQFSTDTGFYTISSIDYTASTLIVTDPLMSTCDSMQNSGSFGLGRAAPFQLTSEDVFVLLGCSTSSPVFDSDEELCDTGSSNLCRGIYSCRGVTGIGLVPNGPISTCCVYKPQSGVSSGYQLDLPKLQCSSYTCLYGFGGNEGDPTRWNYGISLQFNGSYLTDACNECETSAGVCGFRDLDRSFVCVCRNGVNTTTNCYGQGYAWSGTCKQKWDTIMGILGFFLLVGLFL